MPDNPKLTDLDDIEVVKAVSQLEAKLLPWDALVARLQPVERFFCLCGQGFTSERGLQRHCHNKPEAQHNSVTGQIRRQPTLEPVYYRHPVPSHDIRGRRIRDEFILVTIPRRDGLASEPLPMHPQTHADLRAVRREGISRVSKSTPRYRRTAKGWLLIPRGTPR